MPGKLGLVVESLQPYIYDNPSGLSLALKEKIIPIGPKLGPQGEKHVPFGILTFILFWTKGIFCEIYFVHYLVYVSAYCLEKANRSSRHKN